MRIESEKFKVYGVWHYLVSVKDEEVESFERAFSCSKPPPQVLGVDSISLEDHCAALDSGFTSLPNEILILCDNPRFQRFVEELDPLGYAEFTDSRLFARVYVQKRIKGYSEIDRPEGIQFLVREFHRWLESFERAFSKNTPVVLSDRRDSESVPKPGTVFFDGPHCPEMGVVPAGEFMMGSPKNEKGRYQDEGPQHKVKIARAFAVGRFAVTFDEWDACVAEGGCAHKPSDEGWGRGRRPVINVSWYDAQAYVAWLAKKTGRPYRLLSEAEWEYAARAGTTTRYPWGNAPGTNLANFDGSGSKWSGEKTAPVGSFEPNAFGLYDMIGNVWEWVQDCWNGTYQGAPVDGSAWERSRCTERGLRGGSWVIDPQYARSAGRYRLVSESRYDDLGFRVAMTL